MPNRPPRAPAAAHRARLCLLALAGLLAVAPMEACVRRGEGAAAQGEEGPTTVRVRNQAFLDVNVYAVRGGQRVRLGTVTGNSTQVLRIPAFLLSGTTPLRFLADPIGNQRQPTSEEIMVTPGDEVTLYIPPG